MKKLFVILALISTSVFAQDNRLVANKILIEKENEYFTQKLSTEFNLQLFEDYIIVDGEKTYLVFIKKIEDKNYDILVYKTYTGNTYEFYLEGECLVKIRHKSKRENFFIILVNEVKRL